MAARMAGKGTGATTKLLVQYHNQISGIRHFSQTRAPVKDQSLATRKLDMAVELDGYLIVNIYAPANKLEQPQFFQDLEPWLSHHKSIILGGAFNCVLRPSRPYYQEATKQSIL